MTIEERAKEYATKIVGGEYHGGFKGEVWLDRYAIYTEVATEQKQIDIEKACEVYRKELLEIIETLNKAGKQLYNVDELGELISLDGCVKDFHKAMEE